MCQKIKAYFLANTRGSQMFGNILVRDSLQSVNPVTEAVEAMDWEYNNQLRLVVSW